MKKKDGIDFTFIREIKLLQELHHENIIGLLDVFFINDGKEKVIWIVSEFMETDLQKILAEELIQFTLSDCKRYMYMLLSGVEYLHKNWILHRDICPGNLFISSAGILKIGDFGLAKKFGNENSRLTPGVVTLWYRAPELLLGARHYGRGVDMWSVGCVFAEMLWRQPYFPGIDELDQIGKIFWALGTPTASDWQNMDLLPGYIQFKPCEGTPMSDLFITATSDALELLKSLLSYNPNSRPSATEVLNSKYFNNSPSMTPPEKLILRAPQKIKEESQQLSSVEIKQDPMETI